MRQAHRVTITSDWDEAVEYLIIPWGAARGFQFLRELAPLIKEALQAAAALAPKAIGEDGKAKSEEDMDILELATASADAIGPIFARLASLLAAKSDAAYLREILDGVVRKEAGGKGEQPSNEQVFDSVYQANYGELLLAIVEVLKVNYGRAMSRGKRPSRSLAMRGPATPAGSVQ
jgi:hypothetical protein